jgi:hypothetical protein
VSELLHGVEVIDADGSQFLLSAASELELGLGFPPARSFASSARWPDSLAVYSVFQLSRSR